MTELIVTLNAGSSSIKFALFGVAGSQLNASPLAIGKIAHESGRYFLDMKDQNGPRTSTIAKTGAEQATARLFEILSERAGGRKISAVGHRIVHGGQRYCAAQVMNEEVANELQRLIPLAPQHQPQGLRLAQAARVCWPQAQQIACFDTAFHRTQPRYAQLFGLPRRFADEGVLRYGFHGLSYEYIAGAAPQVMNGEHPRRLIVAHLGHGASLCAILNGESIETTMGFTALDGLPMSTRCGAIDPGVLLFMMQQKEMSADEIETCLYEQSGLLGVSGISGDVRALEESDDPRAEEALTFFAYRVVREIGALAAVLGGLDALVFTAGVGENSANVRARVVSQLAWLGFEMSVRSNASSSARITTARSKAAAWVIPTNEEIVIARHALRALQEGTADNARFQSDSPL